MAFRFQNWQVYKDAKLFRQDLKKILDTFPTKEQYLLTDQAKRAMLSVILQIAEGSNRKTEKDKNLFINRALTSLDEIVACLDCALDDNYIAKKTYDEALKKIENLIKQLRGFSRFIQKSY